MPASRKCGAGQWLGEVWWELPLHPGPRPLLGAFRYTMLGSSSMALTPHTHRCSHSLFPEASSSRQTTPSSPHRSAGGLAESVVSSFKCKNKPVFSQAGNGEKTQWEEHRAHYHPQLPLGFLPAPTICSLQTAPQLPDTLPALPRAWGTPCPLPGSQCPKQHPWLQRLGGCRLWLSREDQGLVAAGAPAPQRETYEQI